MTRSSKNQRIANRVASRRGSIYLAVLGVAMVVSIIGMASMSIARLQLRSTRNLQDLEEARLLSQSGVDFGLSNMQSLGDWRTDRTHAVEFAPLALGNGTMTYVLLDDDGDLEDDPTDTVHLRGIGRVGDAVFATSVLLEPGGEGLTSLESSLHSDEGLDQDQDGSITTNQTVSTNGDIEKTNGNPTITGDAWAAGDIDLGVSGTALANQTPGKEMPAEATVFDYYLSKGTRVNIGSIPLQTISDLVMSPTNNPYGTETNPLGIYVIDCQESDLLIQDARIHGTLVILNAGSGTRIDKDIHWEPAVANYPALMVQGNLEMRWHAEHLLSENLRGVNFNPAHSPYQGVSDSDMTDEYTAVIKGLIYISGDLAITYTCNLEGMVLVGGTAEVTKGLTLTYDSKFLNYPPPGFAKGAVMQIVPGTWTRVSY